MTYSEIQSYVAQVCEAIATDQQLDVSIGAPLLRIADSISDVAAALEKIATVLEAASEK
jgi:hypothetical protein